MKTNNDNRFKAALAVCRQVTCLSPNPVQTLRWQLRQRQENGLAGACVPQGKRTLISKARYEQWLTQRAGVAA